MSLDKQARRRGPLPDQKMAATINSVGWHVRAGQAAAPWTARLSVGDRPLVILVGPCVVVNAGAQRSLLG